MRGCHAHDHTASNKEMWERPGLSPLVLPESPSPAPPPPPSPRGVLVLTRLRIPSRFILEGEEVHRVADFKLGLGPCGKVVQSLTTKWTTHSLIVIQVHTDRTCARFIYPRSSITGRIEEEYAYHS